MGVSAVFCEREVLGAIVFSEGNECILCQLGSWTQAGPESVGKISTALQSRAGAEESGQEIPLPAICNSWALEPGP